jgi:hypothetical protein
MEVAAVGIGGKGSSGEILLRNGNDCVTGATELLL